MQSERSDGGSLDDIRDMHRGGEDRTCEDRLARAAPAAAGNRFWARAAWLEPHETSRRRDVLTAIGITLRDRLFGHGRSR